MGKIDAIFEDPMIILYRGDFDYDALITQLRGCFSGAGIIIKEPKFKYKAGGNGVEVEFAFDGDAKLTHYIKIFLHIEGRIWDMKKKDILVNGVKKQVSNGKIRLEFSGKWQLDYAGMYDIKKSDSMKPFGRGWFKNKMLRKLDNAAIGLQFGDNKMTGKKYMEKLIKNSHASTKKLLGMECV